MLAEAKLLRQHKGRLEARMQILEDHNRQLEAQLHRLRQLLDEVLLVFYLFSSNLMKFGVHYLFVFLFLSYILEIHYLFFLFPPYNCSGWSGLLKVTKAFFFF